MAPRVTDAMQVTKRGAAALGLLLLVASLGACQMEGSGGGGPGYSGAQGEARFVIPFGGPSH